jgi:DNA-binding response OmpR family regulator
MEKRIPSILVILEKESLREIVTTSLKETKYTIVTNEQEGQAKLESDKPEIVIIESAVPHEKGLTLLSQMKAKNPKLFVIFLSENNKRPDVMKCIEGGVDGYIIIPFAKLAIDTYIQKYKNNNYFDELF